MPCSGSPAVDLHPVFDSTRRAIPRFGKFLKTGSVTQQAGHPHVRGSLADVFQIEEPKKIWKRLYEARSIYAHGGRADFRVDDAEYPGFNARRGSRYGGFIGLSLSSMSKIEPEPVFPCQKGPSLVWAGQSSPVVSGVLPREKMGKIGASPSLS